MSEDLQSPGADTAEQSLDAIAAGLVEGQAPSRPERRQATQRAEARPATPDANQTTDDPSDQADAGADDEDDDFMDDLTAGDQDDDDPDEPDDVDLEDDAAVVRVKRNGKIEEVTLADLKRSWAGTKGIDARIQEAAEVRNAAKAEFDQISHTVAETRALHERLSAVYQHYNQVLFVPKVDRPHPQMQQDDPIGYFSQMEDWRADQERLGQEQAAMQQTLQAASEQFQQHRRQVLTNEARALHAKMPGLKNPESAKAFKQRIAAIGEAHGFTPQEIAMAEDHRILTIAAEAAAYRELKARLAGKRVKATGEEAAPIKRRPMPSRGDNRQRGETHKNAAKTRKVLAKARESGSVDDVALTLLI